MLQEARCPGCNRLLMKLEPTDHIIETVCPRCSLKVRILAVMVAVPVEDIGNDSETV